MEFEDILNTVGGFGKFQRNLGYFFFFPVAAGLPFFWMSLLFMVSVPDHWCHVPQLQNLTAAARQTLVASTNDPFCSMHDLDYSLLASENQWMNYEDNNESVTVACKRGWEYDTTNYDSTAATKFNLVCDRRHYTSLVLTFQKIGNLIGLPIYGYLSDKFGRKKILMFIFLLTSVTEIAAVFVNDFIVFMILKTINSTGLSTAITLICVLSFELVSPDKRTFMSGAINLGWTFGICLLPLIAYLSRTWIILGLVDGFMAAAFLFYWNYLPESPCWLISQGRHEEAMLILKRIGRVNGEEPDSITLLKQLKGLGERIEKRKKEEKENASTFTILHYPRIRRTFFILTFCVIANNVGYTGLIYNLWELSGNEFFNFFLISLSELPGTVLFLYLMGRMGRRWTAAGGYLFTALACLLPLFNFPHSDVLASTIGKLITTGIYMVNDQQTSELNPTVARASIIGSIKTIATAFTVFLPYISNLNDYGHEAPFILISCTCFMACVLTSFLPETLDENLPQTITDAEEFGRDHKFFSWNRKKISDDMESNGVEYLQKGHVDL